MQDTQRYKMLEGAYSNAMQVCDPIDYQNRQQALLRTIAYYLLDRDKPPVETPPEEEKKDE